MIVAIHQPAYLPWGGWYDKIAKADVFVLLDHVPHSHGAFENRNLIRQPDGRTTWLTVPTARGAAINQTFVQEGRWHRKHCAALRHAYGNNAADWFTNTVPSTGDLDLVAWRSAMLPGLEPKAYLSSGIEAWRFGVKSGLVLGICQYFEADTYLSGPQGRGYLDLPAFEQAGIEVAWHDYTDPDDPPLSAIHHLFGGDHGSHQSAVSDARLAVRGRRRHPLHSDVDPD